MPAKETLIHKIGYSLSKFSLVGCKNRFTTLQFMRLSDITVRIIHAFLRHAHRTVVKMHMEMLNRS